jgi:hypothetical protein
VDVIGQSRYMLVRAGLMRKNWEAIEDDVEANQKYRYTEDGKDMVGKLWQKGLDEAEKNDPGPKVRVQKNMITFDFGYSRYGHFVNLDQ